MAETVGNFDLFNLPTVNGLPDFSQFDLLGGLGHFAGGVGNFLNLPKTIFGVQEADPIGLTNDFLFGDPEAFRKNLFLNIGDEPRKGGSFDFEALRQLVSGADPFLLPLLSDQFSEQQARDTQIGTLQSLLSGEGSISDIINSLNQSFIDNDAISADTIERANKSTEARGGNALISALQQIEEGTDPRKAGGVRAGQESGVRTNISEQVGSEISNRELTAADTNAQKRIEALAQRGNLAGLESQITEMIASLEGDSKTSFQAILQLAAGGQDAVIARQTLEDLARRGDFQSFIDSFMEGIFAAKSLFAPTGSAAPGADSGGGGTSFSAGIPGFASVNF